MNKPVAIPDDVLAILSEDRTISNVMKNADDAPKELPLSWFSASVIHLGGPGEQDLIVEAQGELRGANVIGFWVFQPTTTGYRPVLAAPAHDLIVRKTVSNGHRDIQLLAATATAIHTVQFRFDGKRYVIYSEKWEDIK